MERFKKLTAISRVLNVTSRVIPDIFDRKISSYSNEGKLAHVGLLDDLVGLL